jgi:hypothetical protein
MIFGRYTLVENIKIVGEINGVLNQTQASDQYGDMSKKNNNKSKMYFYRFLATNNK